MNWTKEHQEILEEMAARRCSASTIGAVLGVSRNSVIGRAYRTAVQLCGHARIAHLSGIVADLKWSKLTQIEIAERYGTSKNMVNHINRGRAGQRETGASLIAPLRSSHDPS